MKTNITNRIVIVAIAISSLAATPSFAQGTNEAIEQNTAALKALEAEIGQVKADVQGVKEAVGVEMEEVKEEVAAVQEQQTQAQAGIDTLKSWAAASNLNATEIVSRLSVRQRRVPLHYKYDGMDGFTTGRKVAVKHIDLIMKDGWITDVHVITTDNRDFTNRIPIACSDKRINHKSDHLFTKGNGNMSIVLQDALQLHLAGSEGFVPDDTVVRVESGTAIALHKAVGMNAILDLRIYTDALGLLGGEPNGLLQTEAEYRVNINRTNIPNTRGFWMPYIRTNLNASKLDSRHKYELMDSASFSRTGLVQKNWLNWEVAFSPFATWTHNKSFSLFYTEIGANVQLNEVVRNADTGTITIPSLFLETGFNYRVSSNIGFDLYTRTFVQYSPQSNFHETLQNDDGAIWFQRIGAEVYWNPRENRAGRLFGRVNYTFSYNTEEKRRAFTQVQLGYSVLLSKLVNRN